MLFNSYEFIFVFLPLSFLIFFYAARLHREIAIIWLVLASLFFYGWWNPSYLILILSSMLVNYIFGRMLSRTFVSDGKNNKILLFLGVSFNLGLLAYFKYAGFFVDNINTLIDSQFDIGNIVLPLAISFFTFQQIAYLVDASRGITHEYRFSHYALFVTFFPQLIAGPIVHHKEMLSQFIEPKRLKPHVENIAVGLTIFSIGLFKKTVLADGVAEYASPVFDAAESGSTIMFFEAWGGALAYTMQLYFDFSGYSDMAIGAARLFGIRLPLNFHSPYKATSIVEFWRRWHMTLSRFLRDYLYIPLGGNRHGGMRRYINLFATMLLGGLWHGASWTFVAWGALHGIYLVINHAWHKLRRYLGIEAYYTSRIIRLLSWLLTFVAVVVGWVLFRASDFQSAVNILSGMAGYNGISLPNGIMVRLGEFGVWLQEIGVGISLSGGTVLVFTYLWVFSLLFIALAMPNTQQILSRYTPALSIYQSDAKYSISLGGIFTKFFVWTPTLKWSIIIGVIASFGVLALTSVSEFLYFQF